MEQDKRKRLKQKKFLAVLFQCKAEFDEFQKKRVKAYKKMASNAKATLDSLKKKGEQEITNEERQRTKALENQNFEEYQDMVKKAKNERITKILSDTDRFLVEIAHKIQESKGVKTVGQSLPGGDDASGYDFGNSTLLLKNYEAQYYNFTHTLNEEIKEQPILLEGGTLKKYQLQGLNWMVNLHINKLNGILADEMGLGKTIQSISLICYLMENKDLSGPYLIVAPLSTLTNWRLEFEKWAPRIKKVVYKGNQAERKNLLYHMKNHKFNVCITTYEYILKDKSDLSKFQWQYIIVDEGHKMKNSKSKFSHILGQIYNSEHRILLTGTPLQNNLTELWSLLNFLLPKVFTSSEDFEKWFKMPIKRKTGLDKEIELNEEEKLLIVTRFHRVLKPFILRRVKKEVESELPQKLEFIIKVELSAWQKIIYNQIFRREDANLEKRAGKINFNFMSNVVMQLRKICNHPYLFTENGNGGEELIMCSGKFELLDRIIPKLIKTNHRMLIFTQMTKVIDFLQLFLMYRNIKYLRLDGDTKAEERGERMALFNQENSPYSVFLLSTRAGGIGLNLQSADTVIIFDSDWNPQMDLQAQDRAHRIGTLKEVRVFRLVTNGTIEEEILVRATHKKSLDDLVIQAGLYNNRSTDKDRRVHLEEIIKKQTLDKEDEDEIPNDEEINKMLSRTEEEVALFTELDRLRYEQEKLIYPNFDPEKNYRLMGLNDVPEWLKHVEEARDIPEEPLGKRRPRIADYSLLRDVESDEEDKTYTRLKAKKKKEKTLAAAAAQHQPEVERTETPAEPNDIYNESEED